MIEKNTEFYRNIINNMEEGIYVIDSSNNTIIFWSKGAEKISGYYSGEIVSKKADTIPIIYNLCNNIKCLSHKDIYATAAIRACDVEGFIQGRKSDKIPIKVKIIPLQDNGYKLSGFLHIFQDDRKNISDEEKKRTLAKMAFIDKTTGLVSRQYAEINIARIIDAINAGGKEAGIIMVEIENLKEINDKYGHTNGDKILKAIAETFSKKLEKEDMIYRWEGSRFLIIEKDSKESIIMLLSQKIKDIVEKTLAKDEKDEIRPIVLTSSTVITSNDTLNEVIERLDKRIMDKQNKSSVSNSKKNENNVDNKE